MGAPYTLYYAPGAASLAVHWMLREVGADLTLVKIDFETKEQKSADYLKLNPGGVVPTLIVDGKPQGEAAALLMLIAERHPAARLAPEAGAPGRAAYLQWMFYLANTLQPSFRLWFYPDEGAGASNSEATKEEARKRIEPCWSRIDAHLSDGRAHFLGEDRSAADFMATMLMRWSRNMPRPAQSWPHVAAYLARMKQSPALREVHKVEGLTDWIDV